MQSTDHLPSHWARRLGFVRVFARHWSATDSRTEIPPAGLLPFRARRARPYLYTEQEIQRLLAAAKSLSPATGLRPWTYHCLFGLLAVSGLRISEAIKLERQDVDFYQGVLTIRQTKFNKNRLIPLHTSTRHVLSEYAEHRDRLVPNPSSSCFLLNDWGRCLERSAVRRTFYDLSRQIGLRGPRRHRPADSRFPAPICPQHFDSVVSSESISNWGLCTLLNLRLLFSLHSRIPTNEGLPELVIEYLRPHLE